MDEIRMHGTLPQIVVICTLDFCLRGKFIILCLCLGNKGVELDVRRHDRVFWVLTGTCVGVFYIPEPTMYSTPIRFSNDVETFTFTVLRVG